jgi:hypothetical protein
MLAVIAESTKMLSEPEDEDADVKIAIALLPCASVGRESSQ